MTPLPIFPPQLVRKCEINNNNKSWTKWLVVAILEVGNHKKIDITPCQKYRKLKIVDRKSLQRRQF